MITKLPPPVSVVRVPELFTPSQIIAARECRLKAVLMSREAAAERLPPHPAAERGTVYHKLLERAAKGQITAQGTTWASVESELRALLNEAEARLARDPRTAHFACLEYTLPPVEWFNTTQRVLEVAERFLCDAPPRRTEATTGADKRCSSGLPRGIGRWAEIDVRSTRLRLSGRIDLLERRPDGTALVRDYKTGTVTDRAGQVRPEIELQMRLYALALNEELSPNGVHLEVFDGTRHVIDASPGDLAQTRSMLDDISSGLPKGEDVEATRLATPGAGCTHCPFRHVCSTYLAYAPSAWAGSEAVGLPSDIWGTVVSVKDSGGSFELDLLDSAGRRVRVARLDPRHGDLNRLTPSSIIMCFGLAARRAESGPTPLRHPRNFYELPSNTGDRRAWSLALFERPWTEESTGR